MSRGSDVGPLLGVDFGMTSVCAAVVLDGQPPRMITGPRGDASLSVAVHYLFDGTPVVGWPRKKDVPPARIVTGLKRLLGRSADSQVVHELGERVSFPIVADPAGFAGIDVDGRPFRVVDAAGLIFEQVFSRAHRFLGMKPAGAVVAVPAYFDENQKAAIREAGAKGGLARVELVHEPTAVALAYGINQSEGDTRVVVVDMGGVRMDVSILEVSGNVFDVVATGGDPYLGGLDVDARVTRWLRGRVQEEFGADVLTEAKVERRIRAAAEKAKLALAGTPAVDVHIPLSSATMASPRVAKLRLDRSTLEALAADTVDRALRAIRRTLAEQGLRPDDVDDVFLAGGGCELAVLQRELATMFVHPPRCEIPPRHVIALGAALLADSLVKPSSTNVPTMERPVGMALADGRFMPIVEAGCQLPITRRVVIPSTRPQQRSIEIDLFAVDGADLQDGDYIGTVVFPGLAPAPVGEAKITVDVSIGSDGAIRVSSPESDRSQSVFDFPRPDGADAVQPRFWVAQRDSRD